MVLLSSGQVSALITSLIIFLFTSALFLSGYALQQQTVRDLRAAIKPKEVPKQARLYLPPQFAGVAKPSPKERGRDEVIIEVKQSEGGKSEHKILGSNKNQKHIPIRQAGLYDLPPDADQEPMSEAEEHKKEKPESRAERRRRIKEEIMAGSEEAGFKGYRRRMW